MNSNSIEIESEETLKDWLTEYNKPENQEKITLPNCLYNYHEIVRELLRREHIKGVMEDWK